ncbi:MAG: 1,4-dihydroxy-2-naphthoate octaprenyltransferase [Bacteroidales bacterium]|nr:1,4-dihydroxy-2-naphthoate octaprenyltransferase [Bacteroidales bacterium]
MRPRTLLLSVSAVLTGTFLARNQGFFSWNVVVLLCLTGCFLQILSNLVNELGDWKKGIDKVQLTRKPLSLQNGNITEKTFVYFSVFMALLAVTAGLLLIWTACGSFFRVDSFLFLTLGAVSVVAALFYSAGRMPYGYRGAGDLAVFLFFGPVAVAGSYYLLVHSLDGKVFYTASAMGLLCTAVLNVNNIRDFENDKVHGKNTLAVFLSRIKKSGTTLPAKTYQFLLIVCAVLLSFVYALQIEADNFLFLISVPLFIIHLFIVTTKEGPALDKALMPLIAGIGLYTLSWL